MIKIRNKIIIPITSLIIILIIILIVFFNSLLRDAHLSLVKGEMSEIADLISVIIKDKPGLYTGRTNNVFTAKIKELSEISETRITVTDHNGAVIADSEHDPLTMDNHRYRIEINDAIKHKTGESIRYSNTLNVDMLYFAKSYPDYIVRLARPLSEIKVMLKKFGKVILVAGIVIILTAIFIIIFITSRITVPIQQTKDFALAFSEGDYSKRILHFTDDEIGILQKTLNRMAERIVGEMDSLQLEQNKLAVTLESISDGIAVIDKNKTIVIANKAFISLLDAGNSNVSYINKKYYEAIRGSVLNKNIEQSLAHSKSVNFQEKFLNGKVCEIFITPIKEDSHNGILIVLHDITEKKKIEQLKTDLVGNLSHELKTPVAIVKGYLETMQSNPEDRKMCADFLNRALVNLDRQDSIINDMLKLNMLETMTGISFDIINLKEIVSNCIEILNSKAKEKQIEIHSEIELLDKRINCNKFLAEEIFFNIIINAINYTNPKGKIEIKAYEISGQNVISIADTGIGIPEESIGRIFERFYRVDKSRSRATGGTGLGLSIVKHAAEILDWEINVESSGNGTTFFIKI